MVVVVRDAAISVMVGVRPVGVVVVRGQFL